eukprot:scpid40622/ scgid9174/ 
MKMSTSSRSTSTRWEKDVLVAVLVIACALENAALTTGVEGVIPDPVNVLPRKNLVVGLSRFWDSTLKCSGSSLSSDVDITWLYYDTVVTQSSFSHEWNSGGNDVHVGDGNQFPFGSLVRHSSLHLNRTSPLGIYVCRISMSGREALRYFLVTLAQTSFQSPSGDSLAQLVASSNHTSHKKSDSHDGGGSKQSMFHLSCWFPLHYPRDSLYFTLGDGVATSIGLSSSKILDDDAGTDYSASTTLVHFYLSDSNTQPRVTVQRFALRLTIPPNLKLQYAVARCMGTSANGHSRKMDSFILQQINTGGNHRITPAISPYPVQLVEAFTPFSLRCQLSILPARYTWLRNGKAWPREHTPVAYPGHRVEDPRQQYTVVTAGSRSSTLTMSLPAPTGVTTPAPDVYQCRVRPIISRTAMTVRTTVQVIDRYAGEVIFLHPSIRDLNVTWGMPVTLHCQALVGLHGNMSILWNSVQQSTHTKQHMKMIGGMRTVVTTAQLHIPTVQHSVTGKYTCVTRHGNQIKSAVVTLTTYYGLPEIRVTSSGPNSAQLGAVTFLKEPGSSDSATHHLRCRALATGPVPKLQWHVEYKKDGKDSKHTVITRTCTENTTNSTHKASTARPSDCLDLILDQTAIASRDVLQAQFICTASNDKGTTSVAHQFKSGSVPTITIKRLPVHWEADNQTIRFSAADSSLVPWVNFTVTASPAPTLDMTKFNSILNQSQRTSVWGLHLPSEFGVAITSRSAVQVVSVQRVPTTHPDIMQWQGMVSYTVTTASRSEALLATFSNTLTVRNVFGTSSVAFEGLPEATASKIFLPSSAELKLSETPSTNGPSSNSSIYTALYITSPIVLVLVALAIVLTRFLVARRNTEAHKLRRMRPSTLRIIE